MLGAAPPLLGRGPLSSSQLRSKLRCKHPCSAALQRGLRAWGGFKIRYPAPQAREGKRLRRGGERAPPCMLKRRHCKAALQSSAHAAGGMPKGLAAAELGVPH